MSTPGHYGPGGGGRTLTSASSYTPGNQSLPPPPDGGGGYIRRGGDYLSARGLPGGTQPTYGSSTGRGSLSSDPFTEAQRKERMSLPLPDIWGPSPPPPDDLHVSSEEDTPKELKKRHKKDKKRRKKSKSKKRKRSRRSSSSSSASESSKESVSSKESLLEAGQKRGRDEKYFEDGVEKEEEEEVGNVVEVGEPPIAGPVQQMGEESSSEDEFGPAVSDAIPAASTTLGGRKGGGFGGAMRPGEGAAIAAYVEAGKRVPRRGEVSFTGDQVDKLESLGYVMSGNRNKRMEAVRLRKEGQVQSMEERRQIAMLNAEKQKEAHAEAISKFKSTVQDSLRKAQREQ